MARTSYREVGAMTQHGIYRRAGLLARCIPYYRRVIDVHPGSEAAKKAANILKALQND